MGYDGNHFLLIIANIISIGGVDIYNGGAL